MSIGLIIRETRSPLEFSTSARIDAVPRRPGEIVCKPARSICEAVEMSYEAVRDSDGTSETSMGADTVATSSDDEASALAVVGSPLARPADPA